MHEGGLTSEPGPSNVLAVGHHTDLKVKASGMTN